MSRVSLSLARAAAFWLVSAVAFAQPQATPDAALLQRIAQHGPWPVLVAPDSSNRVAGHAEAVEFGYRMFREPRLAANGYVTCIGCHQTDRAFTDGIARAHALAPLERNTPALANLRLQRWYGWDGASDSLWMASLRPLLDAREFGSDAARVAHVVRIGDGLACRYQRVFGKMPTAKHDETVMVNVAKAMAAFVETLTTGRTRFDDYRDALARGDLIAAAAFPPAAQRGASLFVGRGGCAACHSGPNFSDGDFHQAGGTQAYFSAKTDTGREAGIARWRASPYSLRSRYDDDLALRRTAVRMFDAPVAGTRGRFRTPSLRNVAVTAPYMHDGSVATLQDAVRHNAGELSAGQIDDIVAFLETLSDEQGAARRWPARVQSPCP